jgi:agmatinase
MSSGSESGEPERPWRHDDDPLEPFVEMRVPTIFGAIPTMFGAPLAAGPEDLRGADVVVFGVPWAAPPSSGRTGSGTYGFMTALTPAELRTNSLKYGGYLPELDLDVFQHLRLVDYGDVDISREMGTTLANVERTVGEVLDAGAIPVVLGGNTGPSTYPVVKVIAERAGGPTAVLDFDAHHDNLRGEWQEDSPQAPTWGSTWARRVLGLPGVDPERFYLVGLRGPRNDRETFLRFTERGAKREHIYTYRDIKAARRSGYDEWAAALADRMLDGTDKIWIHIDPDCLDLSSNPFWMDEPLGMSVDEVVELMYQVGRAAGRDRFGGMSFTDIPFQAQPLHYVYCYILVYTLAGIIRGS